MPQQNVAMGGARPFEAGAMEGRNAEIAAVPQRRDERGQSDPEGRLGRVDTGLKLHPDAGRGSEVDVVEISARQTPGDLGPHHATV